VYAQYTTWKRGRKLYLVCAGVMNSSPPLPSFLISPFLGGFRTCFHTPTLQVKEMIAEADLKRNGRVDLEEFLALMGQKRNKEVVDMKETLPTVAKPEE